MTDAVQVRLARPSDLLQIVEIEKLSLGDRPWNVADFAKLSCAVAETGGHVAGFIAWRRLVAATPEDEGEFEILNLAVHPGYRSRGIGRRLLTFCLLTPGVYYLEVRKSNAISRKLYESSGFIEIGTRPDYYENPREAAIVMRRK